VEKFNECHFENTIVFLTINVAFDYFIDINIISEGNSIVIILIIHIFCCLHK